MMLTGLGITGLIYVLVSICAVALVPVGDLIDTIEGLGADPGGARRRARPAVRPDLPVHRHVRGGELGADQHADGEPAALRPRQPGRAAARRSAPCTRCGGRPGSRSSSPRRSPSGSSTSWSRTARRRRSACSAAPPRCCCSASSPSSTSRCIVLRNRPPVGHAHFRAPRWLP